jgi:hypothetical protein
VAFEVERGILVNPGEYPYAAHLSTTSSTALWHAWGSHQVHALALSRELLDRQDWIESARREADVFFAQLLPTDLINEILPLIDWTGLGPDTTENLAPLTFVETLSPAAQIGEIPSQSPDDVAFSVALDGGEPVAMVDAFMLISAVACKCFETPKTTRSPCVIICKQPP